MSTSALQEIRFAQEKEKTDTAADKALVRAKKYEKKLEDKGWRWFKINNRTQVLVPCDENGNPTKEGQQKIHHFNNL